MGTVTSMGSEVTAAGPPPVRRYVAVLDSIRRRALDQAARAVMPDGPVSVLLSSSDWRQAVVCDLRSPSDAVAETVARATTRWLSQSAQETSQGRRLLVARTPWQDEPATSALWSALHDHTDMMPIMGSRILLLHQPSTAETAQRPLLAQGWAAGPLDSPDFPHQARSCLL